MDPVFICTAIFQKKKDFLFVTYYLKKWQLRRIFKKWPNQKNLSFSHQASIVHVFRFFLI